MVLGGGAKFRKSFKSLQINFHDCLYKMRKSHHILNLVHLIDSDDFIALYKLLIRTKSGGGGEGGQGVGSGGGDRVYKSNRTVFISL